MNKTPLVEFVYNRHKTASATKEAAVELRVTFERKQKYTFLRSNHRSFLRSGFVATSSMNRNMNQEGQAVFGSLKGVKVVNCVDVSLTQHNSNKFGSALVF